MLLPTYRNLQLRCVNEVAVLCYSGQAPTRRWVACPATRDVKFAFQQDIRTKLKPGQFAERMDGRNNRVAAAQDWKTVVQLFSELGNDIDRRVGVVADMLINLQRLVPQQPGGSTASQRLTPQDASVLAAGISSMADAVLQNVQSLSNGKLINVIWALALLPDPAKTMQTAAAAAARVRAVAGFGAVILNRMGKLMAEEVFHVMAGLVLLGFKPPRTLQPDPRPVEAVAESAKGKAAPKQPQQQQPVKFGTLLEKRSIKVMPHLNPKGYADAAFVAARLVVAGDISQEWLDAFAKASKQHLPTFQPEAVVYAGYALARHSYRPSNSWQKAYFAAVQGFAKTLAGEELPMVFYTLARWHQQNSLAAAEGQMGFDHSLDGDNHISHSPQGSVGPVAPPGLISDLLLVSYTNRALRELPLSQIAVMVKALGELQVPVNPEWLKRLWPLVNSKIDDAASTSGSGSSSGANIAAHLAALLVAIPHIQPEALLPTDFLPGLVGNLGLGLQQLNPTKLAAVWTALKELAHQPDHIFMRQLQQAVLQANRKATATELPLLVQLGLAVGIRSSSGNSISSMGAQQPAATDAFHQQVVDELVEDVRNRLASVTAVTSSSNNSRQRQQQLDQAQSSGLWQLPQALLECMQHVSAASLYMQRQQQQQDSRVQQGAAAAASGLLQGYLPVLQQLWKEVTIGVAAAMPTEPLLILFNLLVDLREQDLQLLGLTAETSSTSSSSLRVNGRQIHAGSKQQVIEAVLESGVYPCIDLTTTNRKGRGRTATSSAGSSAAAAGLPCREFTESFVVADCLELLVILEDARITPNKVLLDASAEVLHNNMVRQDKGSYSFTSSEEDADTLVQLLGDPRLNYKLPAKVKTRYAKAKGPDFVWPKAFRKTKAAAAEAPVPSPAAPITEAAAGYKDYISLEAAGAG